MKATQLETLIIKSGSSIKEAMQQLNDNGAGILFIVGMDNKLSGTLTDGDIRRALINGHKFSENIENVMTKNYFYLAHQDSDLEEKSRQMMIEKKIEQIPVVGKNGNLIDVILWSDIISKVDRREEKKTYPNKVIIMAGGKGTRLDPFTKILPKPLMPIGNQTIIELIMGRFFKSGYHNFIYSLNYKKEYIKIFLKEKDFPYSLDWVEEEKQLGSAGPLSLMKECLSDTFFVVNCDSLIDIDYSDVMKWHKDHGALITIIGCQTEVKIPFGVLHVSNGKLDSIIEKPSHDVLINTGAYVMEPQVLSYLTENTPMDMNQLLDLVAKKEKVTVYPIYDKWLDVGQWEQYTETIRKIEGRDGL